MTTADNFEFRRNAQKVFVDNGDVVLRLHKTDIVRVKANGDVVLSTGGWATPKTMHSMNDALELFGMWVEPASGRIQIGRWQVTDSDGSVHPYTNDSEHYMVTIKAKDADDRQRAQWLAEAYEVTYTPPAAAAQASSSRVAAGPRVVSAQPAAAANFAGAASTGQTAAAAAAPRAPGAGGSWANIAKSATPLHQATTGAAAASAGRVTGPGAASGGRTTGPGAAAAPSAAHRTTGPPGFSGSSGSTSAAAWQQRQPPTAGPAASPAAGAAAVMSAPPKPADPHRVLQQFAAMGVGHQSQEEEAELCVVCMEEPRSTVLVPCGHMVLCKECCQHIIETRQGKCPVCQQDVEYSVEVNS